MNLVLSKMKTIHENPIQYYLNAATSLIHMNSLINKKIEFHWEGVIHCRKCTKKTKRSALQRPLFINIPYGRIGVA